MGRIHGRGTRCREMGDDYDYVYHTIVDETFRAKVAEFHFELDHYSMQLPWFKRWFWYPVDHGDKSVRYHWHPCQFSRERAEPRDDDWDAFTEFANLGGLYHHRQWRGLVVSRAPLRIERKKKGGR